MLLTSLPALFDPLLEPVHVIKQLGNHKLCPGITFHFQPLHLALCRLRVGMWGRVPSYTYTEMIAVLFANVLDEVVCMLEIIGLG